jgi:hypothetical protein
LKAGKRALPRCSKMGGCTSSALSRRFAPTYRDHGIAPFRGSFENLAEPARSINGLDPT